MCLILYKLGHPQPATPVYCDNKKATGIVNNTVKKQRSRSIEMRFFLVADQVKNGSYNIHWHPGPKKLADYFTKHFKDRHGVRFSEDLLDRVKKYF